MANFKFKSSGFLVSDKQITDEKITKKERYVGIKTPLSNIQGDQIFDMHTSPIDQLKDNLKNLLLTNAGERLGLYNFGSDLSSVLFEYTADDTLESEIVERIKSSVDQFMPGIEIRAVSKVDLGKSEKSSLNKKGLAKIKLRIEFDIPSVRITNQAIEVDLDTGG